MSAPQEQTQEMRGREPEAAAGPEYAAASEDSAAGATGTTGTTTTTVTAANGSVSAKAPAGPRASSAGEPPAHEPAAAGGGGGRRRRRVVLLAVVVAAVIAGAMGSWAYNIGFVSRAADNSAIIRTGADPTTFLHPLSDRHSVVLPVANNSPDAVTVIGLTLPADINIAWDGAEVTIPAGQTADVVMVTPDYCPVTVLPQLQPAQAQVTLRVNTVNGKPHGVSLDYSGVLAYAVAECQIAEAAAGNAP